MNEPIITTDSIIGWLQSQVEQKLPVDAHVWLDACQKITVLLGTEHDKLFELEQMVAKEKVEWIEKGKTAVEAKMRVEMGGTYKEARKQQAKIKRIEEMVRIAKIQARMKDFEYRNSN